MLLCRATLGLAQALESKGKADEAIREYKKVLQMKAVYQELTEDVERRIRFIRATKGRTFSHGMSAVATPQIRRCP